MIVSGENSKVKLVKSLKTRKARERGGCYLMEGPKLFTEALDHHAEILFAFFCEDAARSGTGPGAAQATMAETLADRASRAGVENFWVSRKIFADMAETGPTQTVLAVVKKPRFSRETFFGGGNGNVVVLDRLQDPGNIGTVIRTAAAAGFDGVVAVKGTGDVYAPKTVRAAMGAHFRMPVIFAEDAEDAVRFLTEAGKRILVADVHGACSCYEADLARDAALVIGNEGGGADAAFLAKAQMKLRIPMPGGTESLNASTAAAILMFESVRQNMAKGE
ncbi:MAG: RNA methyltransferase [Clostridiales Family XIII bacterium]|jgi:TrmH family RNA methyltransferase|nr:RNA methyltransferase [Clostridiales Family XIII bacterium]